MPQSHNWWIFIQHLNPIRIYFNKILIKQILYNILFFTVYILFKFSMNIAQILSIQLNYIVQILHEYCQKIIQMSHKYCLVICSYIIYNTFYELSLYIFFFILHEYYLDIVNILCKYILHVVKKKSNIV